MTTLLAGAIIALLNTQPTQMQVTGYTAGYESTGKQQTDPAYKVTASGKLATQGVTIAAGKDIPFDTEIYIPYFDGKKGFTNHGVFVVQDRGGAISDHNIDVYFDNVQDALQFGRQNLEVYILGKEDVIMSEMNEEYEKSKQKENEIKRYEQAHDQDSELKTPKKKSSSRSRKNKKIYPRFEADTHQNSILLVLCTVCNIPLRIPNELEEDFLIADSMTCPACRQKSVITKELKDYIARGR